MLSAIARTAMGRLTAASSTASHQAVATRAFANHVCYPDTKQFGSLEGKVCVVAGAGNGAAEEWGIGTCTAVRFARQGAKVVVVSNIAENAQNCVNDIKKEGGEAMAFEGDMTSNESAKALLDATIAKYGRADVMCNAGVHTALPNGFDKLSPSLWDKCVDINLNAQFHLCNHFVPHFAENGGGNIIHVTTIAGTVGLGTGKQRHGYAAAKAGAAVLTQRLGVEYAKKGIRGNVIQVGYIRSPLVTRAVADAGGGAELMEKVTATRDSYVPRGKQGESMDVADVAAFLASDQSEFVNGSNIFVDGGGSGCTYGP